MGMTEYEHEVEGRLLITARKTVVALERMMVWCAHGQTRREAQARRTDLVGAINEYEGMMNERDEPEPPRDTRSASTRGPTIDGRRGSNVSR